MKTVKNADTDVRCIGITLIVLGVVVTVATIYLGSISFGPCFDAAKSGKINPQSYLELLAALNAFRFLVLPILALPFLVYGIALCWIYGDRTKRKTVVPM